MINLNLCIFLDESMGATGAQVQYNMVRGHLSSMFISLIASYMESMWLLLIIAYSEYLRTK